jgi:transcriptional regulator with XRE-family HTH domain
MILSYIRSNLLLMTDPFAAEARRLRTVEPLSARQIQARLGVSKDRLYELLRGVPAPDWTRRPNAKDGLRAEALALRGEGWSVVDIALELGVAKSTAYQWVKHLPLDVDSERAKERGRQAQALRNIKSAERREVREESEAELRRRSTCGSKG